MTANRPDLDAIKARASTAALDAANDDLTYEESFRSAYASARDVPALVAALEDAIAGRARSKASWVADEFWRISK